MQRLPPATTLAPERRKKVGELPHAVEIRMQAGQKCEVKCFTGSRIVWTVPVLVMQHDIVFTRINLSRDVKPGNRLQKVVTRTMTAIATKVSANHQDALRFVHRSPPRRSRFLAAYAPEHWPDARDQTLSLACAIFDSSPCGPWDGRRQNPLLVVIVSK